MKKLQFKFALAVLFFLFISVQACTPPLECRRSLPHPDPSSEPTCQGNPGSNDYICVRELKINGNDIYFSSNSFNLNDITISAKWCPNADCDSEGTVEGGPVLIHIQSENPPNDFALRLNCENTEQQNLTVYDFENIRIGIDNSGPCADFLSSFVVFEICEFQSGPILANPGLIDPPGSFQLQTAVESALPNYNPDKY